MPDKCAVPRCGRPANMTWLGRQVCDPCWTRHCAGTIDLHERLGITKKDPTCPPK